MQIIYYISPSGHNPVKDFLDELPHNVKAKVLSKLLCLQEYGVTGIVPHVKKLTGTDLWEIRVVGKTSVRIIYARIRGNTALLLHAFYKKSQKTPKSELLLALSRLKKWNQTQK